MRGKWTMEHNGSAICEMITSDKMNNKIFDFDDHPQLDSMLAQQFG